MQVLKETIKLLLGAVMEKPASAAGLVVFGLGFALVAGNALYSQESSHPDPIWSTAKEQDKLSKISEPEIARTAIGNTITRSVLTQRISLKNVPVPTAKPTRSNPVSAQTSLVRDTQSALADIGFYNGSIDGIYGTGTKQAIMNFQQRAGILPNGDVSYDLLNNLRTIKAVTQGQIIQPAVPKQQQEASLSNVNIVSDVQLVTRIQAGLKENFGVENISVDGVMGSQTKSAIRLFQQRFNLQPTGQLDDVTIAKMKAVGVLTNI